MEPSLFANCKGVNVRRVGRSSHFLGLRDTDGSGFPHSAIFIAQLQETVPRGQLSKCPGPLPSLLLWRALPGFQQVASELASFMRRRFGDGGKCVMTSSMPAAAAADERQPSPISVICGDKP